MATLTYDPTPADQPEFSPEEQDSIAVGEQLEAQQNQLLAGKYENAQQLEKAYVELQRKLGEPKEESEPEEEEAQEEPEAQEETADTTEESTDEKEEKTSMSAEDIEYLKGLAGGEEGYTEMITWASENLSAEEVKAYDYVMDLDDPYAAFFAVKALSNAYQNETGREGQMLTGKAAATPTDSYRSQAEVIQAMSDPRYDTDPAYRNDVFEKLGRSNINF